NSKLYKIIIEWNVTTQEFICSIISSDQYHPQILKRTAKDVIHLISTKEEIVRRETQRKNSILHNKIMQQFIKTNYTRLSSYKPLLVDKYTKRISPSHYIPPT